MRLMTAALGLLALIGTADLTSAQTRTTGWIELSQWGRLARSLHDTDQIPVKARCKDKDTKSLNNQSALVNVTLGKNTTGTIDWYWAIGHQYASSKPRLERRGYELVSYDEYRRASGLKVPCAIWHKK